MKSRRKKETDAQFLRRLDRTQYKLVKDGGPTRAEFLRGIGLRFAAIRERREANDGQ